MTTELDSSTGTELAASMIDASKSYKHFKLRNIHFSVQRGTVAGLIVQTGRPRLASVTISVSRDDEPEAFKKEHEAVLRAAGMK